MIEQIDSEISLKNSYTYWFCNYDRQNLYDKSLVEVATFDTLEKFWNIFTSLSYPNELNIHADCLIFKNDIKPLWEDASNIDGGKWILRLKKGLASQIWENLVLSMLTNQFEDDNEICGIVVSVRGQEDILSVWNRSSNDEAVKNKIRETMIRVLQLPYNTVIEYKKHATSIKDSSSFFNTIIPKEVK